MQGVCCKFNAEDIRVMKILYVHKHMNYREIAERFDTSAQYVYRLIGQSTKGFNLYMSSNKTRKDKIDKFYNSIDIKDYGCWEWIKGLSVGGYGRFRIDDEHSAHRSSWIIHNGKIPNNMQVLHKCDNRKCVRPDHLYLGDDKDNAIDRKAMKFYTGELWLIERLLKKVKRGKNHSIKIPLICKMFRTSPMTLYRIRHSIIWPCKDGVYKFNW